MKTKETKTNFINRVMGLKFKNIQGKYSFCNDERRQILFSLDLSNGENTDLILSQKWPKKGYSHSIKHINKILNDGYDLLIYKTRTITKNGTTKTIEFETLLEKRKLIVGNDGEYRASPLDISLGEEISESGKPFFEGSKKTITINAYERNLDAKKECLKLYGYTCRICQFNFKETYGERGKDYIHVHHIIPLSEIGINYKINPMKDLIPVCPNCHAMLHRNGHTILPDELLAEMQLIKNNTPSSN